jgi:two-component system sensor histidine kinase CpxA
MCASRPVPPMRSAASPFRSTSSAAASPSTPAASVASSAMSRTRSPLPSPALRPAAEQVHRELASTLVLVDELLGYARSGLTSAPPVTAALPLAPFLQRIVAAEGVAVRTTLSITNDLAVRADPKLLERALANLARNFLRHTPPAARLKVIARPERDSVMLTISDDGPGVPPEILARLGEPFFRGEAAAPDQPGHGLGLAIVRTCVTACGGEVSFRAAAPHGFAAELKLRPA